MRIKIVLLATLILLAGCNPLGFAKELTASWYSIASLKKEGTWKTSKGVMANGKKFNEKAFTCATRDYPLGTLLEIQNVSSGKSIVVVATDKINKRFKGKRIDLSKAAFIALLSKGETLDKGLLKVEVKSCDAGSK